MKKIFSSHIFWYLLGGIVVFMLLYLTDNHIITTKTKPTIDYKLESNGKQIDTIWIYNFKKH